MKTHLSVVEGRVDSLDKKVDDRLQVVDGTTQLLTKRYNEVVEVLNKRNPRR